MAVPCICPVVQNAAGNVLSNLFGVIFTLISNPIILVRKCNNNVDNLKNKVTELKAEKETVENYAEAVDRRGEQIAQKLRNWLTSANNRIEVADDLVADAEGNAKKCFFGLCLNPKSRYQLSKKAEENSKTIDKLVDEARGFNLPLSHIPAPQQEVAAPVKGFEDFTSRRDLPEKIMEALRSQSGRIIGVHGMAGIGKTMLVKEVKTRAEQDKLFDAVVMALVSRNAELKNIQVEIARGLGLDQLPNGITTQDAAERIKAKLKKMKKVLIILDDIWGPAGIDLEKLGIPPRNEPKTNEGSSSREEFAECKILITSRDSDVLTDLMGSSQNFRLHQLEFEEGWQLLKRIVGDRAESDDEIHSTAIEIVQECGGLPLAITTIATALKNKKPYEWRDALRKLRKPSLENFNGVSAKVYSAIEVSYSHLESEQLKKTFLLCCLIGHKYVTQDLLRYGVALGLLSNAIEEARDEVFTLIRKLKASSLLIDDYDDDRFDMHDLIHDVAVSIACRDRLGLLLTGDHIPKEWSDMEAMKDFKWILMRYANVHGLPEEFKETAFNKLRIITVERCDKLKNLFSSSIARQLLQLQEISVTYCYNIEEIVDDEDQGSKNDIVEATDQLKFGKALRSLRLTGLPKLISIKRSCRGMQLFNEQVVFPNLEELQLSGINVNTIWHPFITTPYVEKLTKLIIEGCDNLEYLFSFSMARGMVMLGHLEIKQCEKMREVLFIENVEDNGNLTFPQLRVLLIEKLSKLRMFCSGNYIKFPCLLQLTINSCPVLKTFISDSTFGHMTTTSEKAKNTCTPPLFDTKVGYLDLKLSEEMFPLLNSIILKSCSNLICFYEGRKRLKFGSLKQITIADCPILVAFASSFSREQRKEVTADDKGSEERLNIPTQPFFSDKVAFPNLKELQLSGISVNNIWPTSITSSYVEKLTKLIINGCDNLKYLFSYSMARDLEMLGHLEIHECKKMREVLFMENIEENGNLIFPQLRFLLIQNLPKLRGFCYGNYIKFPCLSRLSIKCCPVLKMFISGSTFGYMTTTSNKAKNICTPLFDAKVRFTKLEQLILEDMGSLDQIWDNQLDADSFCQLNQLRVKNCGKLLNIFPFSMLEKLQSLDKLEIWYCDSLEEIFESQGVGVSQSQAQNITHSVEPATKFVFSTLRCLELDTLPKLKAFCHQMHTIECPSLKELKVSECNQVQTFASELLSFPRTKGDNDELEIQAKYPLFWISKATFPSLEKLKLRWNENMKEIWHGKYSGDYFPKLTRMRIIECHMLKEIVAWMDDKEKDGIIVFSQLKYLELRCLPRLASFCSGNCNFEFLSLKEVIVTGCLFMQIFSKGECSTPNKLQKVKFIVEDEYEGKDEGEDEGEDEDEDEDKDKDEGLWEGNLNSTIQKMFTEKAGYPGLKSLKLSEFPELIEIWIKKPQDILLFKSLEFLEICKCNHLRYLLTTSMMMGLPQLLQLQVTNCVAMEQVIRGEGAEEMFPNLCYIILESCPNVKCFCEGSSRLKFPNLFKITVVDCPVLATLATFTSSFLSEQEKQTTTNDREGEESSFDIPTQPFLSDKTTFPDLEYLKLEGNNIMKEVWRGHHPGDYFPSLHGVELINFPEQSAILPPFFFQSLPYLSKLVISNASFDEIFQCEGVGAEENPANTLPWLRQKPAKPKRGHLPPRLRGKPANALTWLMEFKLSKLQELKYLWKEELHLEWVFNNLEILKVEECSKLKNIVPSFISFENLTTLEISKCHGLTHVVGYSTAKSMVHLKRMSISECDMIDEIVALGDEEMKDGICLNDLEYLELCYLPKLASFCSGNCGFDFPTLEEVIVMECPNMQVFSTRQLSTPELEQVKLKDGNECYWYGNLNSTIQRLFMEKGSYDSEKDITGGYEN